MKELRMIGGDKVVDVMAWIEELDNSELKLLKALVNSFEVRK